MRQAVVRASVGRSTHYALRVADRAHGEQRYGPFTYGYHLRATIAAARELGFGGRLERTVAALHDSIEDTPMTWQEIASRFGTQVADAVQQLTRSPSVSTEAYLAGMNDLAFSVKLADRLANLRMNGTHLTGPDDLAKQQTRILPKYQAEQALLDARAAGNPRFEEACRVLRVELQLSARRLGVPTQ
jgi:(p)ppGpp synthase/HD superfamily hydrolase